MEDEALGLLDLGARNGKADQETDKLWTQRANCLAGFVW